MNRNYLSTLLLFCLSGFIALPAFAQEYLLKGRILDAESGQPLAFVNVLATGSNSGAATDIDGKFVLHTATPARQLKVTYVGYQPLLYTVEAGKKEQLILLTRKEVELSEVVIKPGINPAHRIIRSVLENRNVNNHEKLGSFTYTSYEKTTFGPEGDSLPPLDPLTADSSEIEMRDFFEKQHLFLMESVTERKFMYPDKSYNKVIASRVSGFGDPLFVFLMSQLQSTSFYRDIIKIADKDYVNPVSPGTFSKYYFEIQDTLVEPYPYDTTFIISFRPLMKTNFDGLKGVISISTNRFAIRNVIAQPSQVKGTFTVKIQQLYDFIEGEQWFPMQLNTDLIFQGAIGKGGIAIGVGSGFSDSTRRDMVGCGKSYISNIRINPELRKSDFSYVEVDVQPDAYRIRESVWDSYRSDSLTLRDRNTYHVLDSIGKAENFDRLGLKMDALLNGKIPVGPLDLELDRITRVNQYEGFRLGLGMHTNDKVLTWASIGGYGAYGFKDKAFKYGANLEIQLDRFREASLHFSYSDDVDEAGADDPFRAERRFTDLSQFRQIMINRMDHGRIWQVTTGMRMLKYLKAEISFTGSNINPEYAYGYLIASGENLQVTTHEFRSSELGATLRYAYGEKFLKNTRSIVSMGTTYPVFQLYIGKGLKGFADGEFSYGRVELQVQKTFTFKYLGKSSLTFKGGLTDSNLPYCKLFNGISNYEPFSFYAPNSFATMRMNEFTADRYAALFLKHDFGKLLFRSKYFNPRFAVLTNMGIGFLEKPQYHTGIVVKDYSRGYFESGLLVNNLLNAGITRLGIGTFYRYGYYTFPGWRDNLSLKLSLEFTF